MIMEKNRMQNTCFMEKIKKNELNWSDEIILKLQKSNLPLLLYGNAVGATQIKKFLEDNNIKIDSVVVGDEYYKPELFFQGYKVESQQNALNRHDLVNIIIACRDYAAKIAELKNNSKISECLFLDPSSFFSFYHHTYYDFIKNNVLHFENLYNRLADELSKKILIAYINAKMSANPEELVSLNVNGEKQYFSPLLQLHDNDVFVDCGAYDGENSLCFNELTNHKGKIYAFECDKSNIEKLERNTKHFKNIIIIKKGAWSEKTTLFFNNDNSMGSRMTDEGESQIEVDSIDNVVRNEKAVIIKMDIEGAELEALKGASKTITSCNTRLAISVYHKPEDLITIPQYILSLNANYELYLRHYEPYSAELVLYAIPKM
jgi:FkbM family methyltransferase